jgi:hypothetical protein
MRHAPFGTNSVIWHVSSCRCTSGWRSRLRLWHFRCRCLGKLVVIYLFITSSRGGAGSSTAQYVQIPNKPLDRLSMLPADGRLSWWVSSTDLAADWGAVDEEEVLVASCDVGMGCCLLSRMPKSGDCGTVTEPLETQGTPDSRLTHRMW